MRPIHRRRDPRVAKLRVLKPLKGLTERELDLVAATFDEVDLPAGAVLTREGRTAVECYLIGDGEAEVSIDGKVVARVGPGEFVGEMALVSDAPRSATVTALTPMHLFTIHRRAFRALLDHAHLTRTLLAYMTERLRRAEGAPEEFLAGP
jgi:cAMP-dependent protein kinase regulator